MKFLFHKRNFLFYKKTEEAKALRSYGHTTLGRGYRLIHSKSSDNFIECCTNRIRRPVEIVRRKTLYSIHNFLGNKSKGYSRSSGLVTGSFSSKGWDTDVYNIHMEAWTVSLSDCNILAFKLRIWTDKGWKHLGGLPRRERTWRVENVW